MSAGVRLGVGFTVAMAALAGYNVGTGDLSAALSVVLLWAILVGIATLTEPQEPPERRAAPSAPSEVHRVIEDYSRKVQAIGLVLAPPSEAPFDWEREL